MTQLPSTTYQAAQRPTDITDHIDGICTFENIDLRMRIHTNDSIESKTAHEHFFIPPQLTLMVILEGDLDASIDKTPLGINAHNGPMGYFNLNRKPMCLDRWTREGQRIRKLTVSYPLESILRFLHSEQQQNLFLDQQSDLILANWKPTKNIVEKVEKLLAKGIANTPMDRLDNTIVALELLRDALSHHQICDKRPPQNEISTRDSQRARQIKYYIVENLHASLSLQEIANNTGMSASTLQRVFKSIYGMTVIKFMRTRQLEIARLALLDDGITVGEAAYNAGYSCTANFSTAFQREFGTPPSACIRESIPQKKS